MKFVAGACDAEIKSGSPEAEIKNVCTDSRLAKPGDAFFAIKGEKFDGHDFIADVAGKGVAAVVVEKIPAKLPGCAVLAVDDVRIALGKFAAAYRQDDR
ncbi:MAG: UDP-N-acetylmuramoyl-tripeptide--D-alanyl-D-alanine ligase [Verrucomicrobiota bacterium]